MLAVRGFYDGAKFTAREAIPVKGDCEVIITFIESPRAGKNNSGRRNPVSRASDDGSLTCLFRGYQDDGIREPLVDFGQAIGAEKW